MSDLNAPEASRIHIMLTLLTMRALEASSHLYKMKLTYGSRNSAL